MDDHQRRTHDYRLSRAAQESMHDDVEQDEQDDDSRAGQRLERQALWVDFQIRQAMARGEFDNLPGAGKPIPGIDRPHDPDWWLKSLIQRERITGVLPPALALRKDDAALEDEIDRCSTEKAVTELLDGFNRRVVEARRQLQGGPPVITPLRDVDAELQAWRDRRAARLEASRRVLAEAAAAEARQRPRRWWRRRIRRR